VSTVSAPLRLRLQTREGAEEGLTEDPLIRTSYCTPFLGRPGVEPALVDEFLTRIGSYSAG
jgi:hypothetical protein